MKAHHHTRSFLSTTTTAFFSPHHRSVKSETKKKKGCFLFSCICSKIVNALYICRVRPHRGTCVCVRGCCCRDWASVTVCEEDKAMSVKKKYTLLFCEPLRYAAIPPLRLCFWKVSIRYNQIVASVYWYVLNVLPSSVTDPLFCWFGVYIQHFKNSQDQHKMNKNIYPFNKAKQRFWLDITIKNAACTFAAAFLKMLACPWK